MLGGWARVPDIEQLYAGRPIVFPDGRQLFAADPKFDPLLEALAPLDWQACMCVFMNYRGTVVGDVAAYFPAGVSGPTEAELSFLVGLADHAAVAVANARLPGQAQRAAALEERARLARELHDSVSQALFSMTRHARAAEKALSRSPVAAADLAIVKAASDIAALRELTTAALAEMRTDLRGPSRCPRRGGPGRRADTAGSRADRPLRHRRDRVRARRAAARA